MWIINIYELLIYLLIILNIKSNCILIDNCISHIFISDKYNIVLRETREELNAREQNKSVVKKPDSQ